MRLLLTDAAAGFLDDNKRAISIAGYAIPAILILAGIGLFSVIELLIRWVF